NDDLTVVVLENCEGCLLLASCYMAHDVPAPPDELRRLVDMVCSSNKHLIIGTYANAHHSVWGSPEINDRGESVLDFILNYKLRLANRGEESTYVGPTFRNVLDLTIATECTNVEEWRVLDRPSFSDHKYIQFTIPLNRVPAAQPFRNPRNMNWAKYSSLVSKSLGPPCNINSVQDLETTVNVLSAGLLSAFRQSCRLSRPTRRSKPPWWSPDLSSLRGELTSMFQLAKKADDKYVWDEYMSLLKSYKKMIRSSKRSSWITFCSDLDNIKDTSTQRKLLSKQASLLKSGDRVWTESSAETLEVLLSSHFPGCIGIENSDWQIFPSLPVMRPPAGLITDNKIIWAIDSFAKVRSPGLDGLSPAMLQASKPTIVPWLSGIYSACLAWDHILT
ncbi:hypothetical protein KR215_002500, partial [Drosophila sulfurigaster]